MKSQLYVSLIAGAFLIVSFQNCESAGTGASSSAALNTVTSGGPIAPTPTPTATPAPPVVAVDLDCVDASGNTHANGSSWSETSAPSNPMLCPNTVEDYVLREEALNYTCIATEIVTVSDAIEPLNAPPSCRLPSLSVSVAPANPLVDTSSSINVVSANVSSVAMSCSETDSGTIFGNQSLAVGTVTTAVSIEADSTCTVTTTAADGSRLSAQVGVDVNCGNKIKVGGHCEDFSCTSFVAIAPSANGTFEVPARSANGICYAVQLDSAIANSPSNLTTTIDTQVVSRNHDLAGYTANDVHNPYLMGKSVVNFNLAGPRTVKVAGSGDSLSPILVDNFVLSGVYPASNTNPDASFYRAYGTSDATVGTTGGVLLNNVVVPLTAFASGGTSTVAPLDLTDDVSPNTVYTLDLRAEDCGGSRQLSNLFLVFQ